MRQCLNIGVRDTAVSKCLSLRKDGEGLSSNLFEGTHSGTYLDRETNSVSRSRFNQTPIEYKLNAVPFELASSMYLLEVRKIIVAADILYEA
jgi:hypothetical protein